MTLTKTVINNLVKRNQEPGIKVSIYIPTHPKSHTDSLQQDQTRFKNAVQKIKNNHADIPKDIFSKLYKLEEDLEFWRHQQLGLAVFVDKQGIETIRLPIEITELATAGKSFVLSSLFLAQSMQFSSLVVDINLENPRVFIADNSSVTRLEEYQFMSIDELMEQDYQHHQHLSSPRANRSTAPMYHGHGGAEDHRQEEIDLYLQYVARNLNPILHNNQLSVILAGEKNRLAEFENLLNYKHINEKKLYGNHQHMNEAMLQPLVAPIIAQSAEDNISHALSELNNSRQKVEGWHAIINALSRKAIDRLFLPIIRKTKDGVNGDESTYLLETSMSGVAESKEFDKWISATLEQGGEIQAVPYDVDINKQPRPQAMLRF